MDIFTNALTRVVQVPIKPANSKVKAPAKAASAGEIKEDLDNLENHDTYFDNKAVDDSVAKEKRQEPDQDQESSCEDEKDGSVVDNTDNTENDKVVSQHQDDKHLYKATDDAITEAEDGSKHLDIYI